MVREDGPGACGGPLLRASLRHVHHRRDGDTKENRHHHKSRNDTGRAQNKAARVFIKTNTRVDTVRLTLRPLSKQSVKDRIRDVKTTRQGSV